MRVVSEAPHIAHVSGWTARTRVKGQKNSSLNVRIGATSVQQFVRLRGYVSTDSPAQVAELVASRNRFGCLWWEGHKKRGSTSLYFPFYGYQLPLF